VAPLPVIANVYRCTFEWTNSADSSIAANVMHFRKSSSNPAAVATIIDNHVTGGMWGMTAAAASVSLVEVTALDGVSTSYPFSPTPAAKWSGQGGSGDFNKQVAAIMKFVTAKRGRSYRGRIYAPWPPESLVTRGSFSPTDVAGWTSAWITFGAAVSGDGLDHVIASYKLASAEKIIAYAGETLSATQRRRIRKVSR